MFQRAENGTKQHTAVDNVLPPQKEAQTLLGLSEIRAAEAGLC
jgi:hypothetical protein